MSAFRTLKQAKEVYAKAVVLDNEGKNQEVMDWLSELDTMRTQILLFKEEHAKKTLKVKSALITEEKHFRQLEAEISMTQKIVNALKGQGELVDKVEHVLGQSQLLSLKYASLEDNKPLITPLKDKSLAKSHSETLLDISADFRSDLVDATIQPEFEINKIPLDNAERIAYSEHMDDSKHKDFNPFISHTDDYQEWLKNRLASKRGGQGNQS